MASSANPRQLPSKTCGCPRCRETYPGERAKTKNCTAKWQARYYDAGGRRLSRTFATRREAVAFLDAQRSKVRDGTWIDPKRATGSVAEFREEWLQARAVENTTSARNESSWNVHVGPRWADVPLAAVTHLDVQQWVKGLSPGNAPKTISSIFNCLDMLLAAALRDRRIPFNPCEGVVMPKRIRKHASETRPPSGAALSAICENIGREVYRQMPELDAEIGLRWGEIITLRPWHLDLEHEGLETVHVKEVIEEIGGKLTRRAYPKSDASMRSVPLTRRAVELFKIQLAITDPSKERSLPSAGICPESLIFRGVRKGALSRNTYRDRVWLPATTAAGVHRTSEGYGGRLEHWPRFHSLRHLFASRMENGGLAESTRKELMGHERPTGDVTWLYTHAAEQIREAFLDAMDPTRLASKKPATTRVRRTLRTRHLRAVSE